MPDAWFDRYLQDQNTTGFVQKSGTGGISNGPPRTTTPVRQPNPSLEPLTPNVVGLMTELTGYVWGLAVGRLRGWWT